MQMNAMAPPRRLAPSSRRLLALSLAGFLGGAGVLWGATGCGSAEPAPVPPKSCDVQVVTLQIYAQGNINPNENGHTRPVVVRLYQLKNDVRMENATYDQILLKDKETLEDDLLKVDEVSVFPNDLVEVKFERNKEAGVLAGVALFRSPKGNSWKTYYAFPLLPGEASCGGRAADAGKPEADPKATFFVESTKIDNGSQLDESMFPDARAIRKVALPKKSTSPEGPGTAPAVTPLR
jgi:type VI secretion system protein VasD